MPGQSRTESEKELLKAIRDLPESDLEKVIEWVHCLKDQFADRATADEAEYQSFLDSFGSWKDERSAQEIIEEIRASRKSINRRVQL